MKGERGTTDWRLPLCDPLHHTCQRPAAQTARCSTKERREKRRERRENNACILTAKHSQYNINMHDVITIQYDVITIKYDVITIQYGGSPPAVVCWPHPNPHSDHCISREKYMQ